MMVVAYSVFLSLYLCHGVYDQPRFLFSFFLFFFCRTNLADYLCHGRQSRWLDAIKIIGENSFGIDIGVCVCVCVSKSEKCSTQGNIHAFNQKDIRVNTHIYMCITSKTQPNNTTM